MVIFERIRWKNLLSTGNVFTEVNLNSNKTTLIVGKNGHGKSTILDAITFGLFGKAFRNITKPQLVNSINQKGCVVEVEFRIGSVDYKVIRGIKPNVFEIYSNGTMINQDSALKDYQKVLEQQILKFNYRTFTQVVILGSASFVPFMQLPTAVRREVIEDILDIKIFSVMNSLLKDEISRTKDSLVVIDSDIEVMKERVASQQKVITILEEGAKKERDRIIVEIAELQKEIDSNNANVESLLQKVTEYTDTVSRNRKVLKKLVDKQKTDLATLKIQLKGTCEHINFFKNNDTCVTCSQELNHEHKKTMLTRLNTEGDIFSRDISAITDELKKLDEELEQIDKVQEQINEMNTAISNYNSLNYTANSRINKLKGSVTEYNAQKIDDEKAKLKGISRSAIDSINRKKELMKLKGIQDVSSLLLKDGGIKTTIIKEYLPIFNKLINRYLTLMDFYVNFEIDETFSEKIRSRGRDEFTYSSFSEGEKQKIDLALLFTFRQIAKMKNSLSTNLLIMDEVLDGSLDSNGIEYVINILSEIGEENTNIFVISHNTEFTSSDTFGRVLQFEKKTDFSTMLESKTKFNS